MFAVTVLLRCCYGAVTVLLRSSFFFENFEKKINCCFGCCYVLVFLYNLDLHLGAGTHT